MKRFAVIGLFTTLLFTGFSCVADAAAVYTVTVENGEHATFSGAYPAGYSIWNKGDITIGTTGETTYFRNNTSEKTTGGALYNTAIINSITKYYFSGKSRSIRRGIMV